MKMEECTLFVGCTSNFIAADKDDNHIDATDGDVTDESDTTNCVDLDAGSSNIRMNKHGQRERTSEGLTKKHEMGERPHIQTIALPAKQ
jgi:hypothetical protein